MALMIRKGQLLVDRIKITIGISCSCQMFNEYVHSKKIFECVKEILAA